MRAHVLFPLIALALVRAPSAGAELGRFPPPRPEVEQGPPPLSRAPEHGRKPFEIVPEFSLSLPTCRTGADGEHCAAQDPALGGGLTVLHRPNPYFAFGAGLSYARSSEANHAAFSLSGEMLAVGARGRVYLYETGAFDPYLELELGYGSLSTTLVTVGGARYENAAFGPQVRVGGGVDFVVVPSFELGGAFGFSELLLERGERCSGEACVGGSAPSGSMRGALIFGLRATLGLGDPL